jgi:hypothetical protein
VTNYLATASSDGELRAGTAAAASPAGSSPLDVPPPGRAGEAFKVALAALRVPAVARLYGGRLGEIATYYPGGRVEGVRVEDDRVEMHIVVRLDRATPLDAAEQVRRAVGPIVAPKRVDVVVEDVEWLGNPDPSTVTQPVNPPS